MVHLIIDAFKFFGAFGKPQQASKQKKKLLKNGQNFFIFAVTINFKNAFFSCLTQKFYLSMIRAKGVFVKCNLNYGKIYLIMLPEANCWF